MSLLHVTCRRGVVTDGVCDQSTKSYIGEADVSACDEQLRRYRQRSAMPRTVAIAATMRIASACYESTRSPIVGQDDDFRRHIGNSWPATAPMSRQTPHAIARRGSNASAESEAIAGVKLRKMAIEIIKLLRENDSTAPLSRCVAQARGAGALS